MRLDIVVVVVVVVVFVEVVVVAVVVVAVVVIVVVVVDDVVVVVIFVVVVVVVFVMLRSALFLQRLVYTLKPFSKSKRFAAEILGSVFRREPRAFFRASQRQLKPMQYSPQDH